MLLCFLSHLVPDHADLQCCFHESRLITSTWPGLNGGTLTPASISQGILFVGRFQAEASPKDEGDFCLPKRGDNRRKNKDENLLSSQLNLFRLIPARVIQTAAKPRFP